MRRIVPLIRPLRSLLPLLPLLALALLPSACAHAQASGPCPVPTVSPCPTCGPEGSAPSAGGASVVNGASLADSPRAGSPSLAVLLRPSALPAPLVHVQLELDPRGALGSADLTTWRLRGGVPARIAHASARDAKGDIAVVAKLHEQGPAIDLVLARAPAGAVTLAYDVLTGDDSPDDPFGLLVQDDRFRGAGEKLIALPDAAEDIAMPVVLKIDGEPLRADKAASSLGVGAVRRATIRPRALRYASFLAGSLGAQVIDAVEGHDEAAWLGYTAFDPRPVVAELAQMRTGFAELFKAQGLLPGPPETYLLMARARPIGSFSTTPRFESVLLQLGASEPWAGPLRLSMAQQLARRWTGDVLRFTVPAGHEAELGWFNDGVARYVATLLLARMGLLAPNDWQEAISGELAVLATSPYASKGAAELAALATKDPVARATMMARGALYALRESAAIEARTKGEKRLETELAALVKQAENEKTGGTAPLPESAWLDALTKDDPDAAKTFDAIVTKGAQVTLPANALGPCFRAGTGEYVAFDAGFDVDATRIEKDGKVTGVRADGPAAKAGLKDGDVLESMSAREDDANVPVKIVVTRGGQKVNVTYVPRGAHGRGQKWTRVKGLADEKCGEPR